MYAAWIDESQSNSKLDPGTYLLSAAIIENSRVDDLRIAMSGLLLPGQRKLHWSDESRHEQIIKVVADLGIEHLIAVRSEPGTTARPERQRRLCLDRLIPELHAYGVTTAILESRGRKDDQRDRVALNNMRRRKSVDATLRMDHVGGPADPLLWIPDACCGALTQHRCGNSVYYDAIASAVTLIEVTA